jgi:hypothetical protein
MPSTPAAPAPRKWKNVAESIGTQDSRNKRQVIVTCPVEGKPYDRENFKQHAAAIVGDAHVECVGPLSQGHLWQLTFDTEANKDKFVAGGDFQVKPGRIASITSHFKRRLYVRVHWVPYAVLMQSIVDQFEKIPGIVVLSATYTISAVA